MRTVHALTSGSYSDFRVHAVFEREEDAQAAVDAGAGDDHQPLTVFGPGGQPRRTVIYRAYAAVGLLSHAQNAEPRVVPQVTWIYDGSSPQRPQLRESSTTVHLDLNAEGEDREAALKVVADRYARLVAEREGIA